MSDAEEKKDDLVAIGAFDEMVNLASTRAFNDDGVVIIHKKFCGEPQKENCPCQPLVIQPYQPVAESDAQGSVN